MSPGGAPLPRCPLCGGTDSRIAGLRGNHEFPGADRNLPHLVTNVLRCRNCEFYYMESLVSEAASLQERYYADAAAYGGMRRSASALRSRLSAIERHASSGQLLDIGAGKGEFVRAAGSAGWKAVGIEPSTALAGYAREHGADVRDGFVGQSSILPTGTFEVVTLIHVLEHVTNPIELLTSLRAYLKPDGLLFVEVPNCDSYFIRLVDLYYSVRGLHWSARLSPFHPPYHRWGYTKKSLIYALEHGGFVVKETGTFSGRDRGYGLAQQDSSLTTLARAAASMSTEALGNRELLYATARPR